MNVYTHVAMDDLHADVEPLPGSLGKDNAETPALPAELPGLISSWKDLPANVRSAIASLAGA